VHGVMGERRFDGAKERFDFYSAQVFIRFKRASCIPRKKK